MYDVILEISHAIVKNGLNLSALGTVLFILLKRRRVKKVISRYFPWLAMEPEDVANYEARQIRIEQDVRAIKEHLGVKGWDAHSVNISKLPKITSLRKKNLLSLLAGLSRALTTGAFTTQTERSNHFKTREGNTQMKNYLTKLGSRKFQAFLAVTIPNLIIMFGFILGNIDLEGQVNQWMPAINLVIQAITTATYQRAEANVDVATVKAEVKYDGLDLAAKDSEGA